MEYRLTEDAFRQMIRDIPDFPVKGVLFRDITPVLKDPNAFREAVRQMTDLVRPRNPDVIVGIESRGFILGAPIALELGVGFVPVRKQGKLPGETVSAEYALEYGTAVVEMHNDAFVEGSRAVIVDDLLATGGTGRAAAQLVERLGGIVAGLTFFIELEFLEGRSQLQGYNVDVIVKY